MARLWNCGFEHIPDFGGAVTAGSDPLYQLFFFGPGGGYYAVGSSYTPRTGNYCAYGIRGGMLTTFSLSASELYIRWGFQKAAYEPSYTLREIFSIWVNGAATQVLRFRTISGTEFAIERYTGTVWSNLSNVTGVNAAWNCYELYWKYGNPGEITFRINGVDWFTFSGDTQGSCPDASTGVQILFSNWDHLGVARWTCAFDDLSINDTTGTRNNSWCGQSGLYGIVPDAEGAFEYLSRVGPVGTEANWEVVSEVPVNDGYYVFNMATGESDLYGISDLAIGNGVVNALSVLARARNEAAGSQAEISAVLRQGSTNDIECIQVLDAGTSWQRIQKHFQTNPITGLPWTLSDLAALQLGVRID